jgi:hypothetical protein
MSELKLPAASGGGSISIKGPASSGSDVDLLDTSGNFKPSGQMYLNDDKKLIVGTGGDMEIYHLSDQNYIYSGNGRINLRASEVRCENGAGTEVLAKFIADGACELRHNDTAMCSTSATGLDIASGKGITFGNSGSNGQGGATLLDDYEEGVYTPTWSGGVTNKSNYAEFTFVKVGNLVHLSGAFCCNTTTNSGSDNPKFTLPFTAGNNSTNGYNVAAGALRVRNIDYATGFFVSNIDGASAYCNFYYGNDDGDWVLLRSSDVSTNDELTICITYRCA